VVGVGKKSRSWAAIHHQRAIGVCVIASLRESHDRASPPSRFSHLWKRNRPPPRTHDHRHTGSRDDMTSLERSERRNSQTVLQDAVAFDFGRWAPIPLRLIVGYGFMAHGFAKFFRGADSFASILHAIGVPAPYLMSWATILIEIFGGLAILLGAFTLLASLPMAAVLLVAIFTVHWPYGFSSIKLLEVTAAGAHFGQPGYECDLLYLACLATLVLGGAGPLSVDELIAKRTRGGTS
jgi:putative oxidoreductase